MSKKRSIKRHKKQDSWDGLTPIAMDVQFSPQQRQSAIAFEAPDGQWRAICSCYGEDGGLLECACDKPGCPIQLWLDQRAAERS